ncbi:LLM class flavin-dependent oxidoreductase [Burkholderia vietnamiensis]|jgi:alkanesulfonate monooxygenase|uniref:LLM class flavin-dependent oxidoreductase n=1 Tax=Burkholderia vietnamiensis TaxID=60552 RepID=A0AAQ1LTH3_BURVI|nr:MULTISPECIES: LLM class flavin-dependent oxidoreductase [Burkholderia]KKI37228.1 alkanesulfonate monooxygenase [Burkholderia vietnamiensis]KVF08522.1 alkanesulfonate monooxygenase [Burkholderia vietnamiensis]KVF40060.1 alkanesulfonate monooxygenase [Burkholderia vietnamiensis]KVF98891.1 alkanesulfonate monooxygenase [Burkholderia vietnamiensis]KVR79101.1 alkanesulfonate monooxygenase [Burkholderia vietnamiensis]
MRVFQPLKIHWCAPRGAGNTKASERDLANELDLDGLVDFAQEAEDMQIDTLLMGIGFHLPEPLPLIGALARETRRLSFMLAYRPGLLPPTLFAQAVNTLSWMSNKRISLNIVAGISPEEQAYYGDYLAHDARYERTSEYLGVLHRFWRGETPVSHEGTHYRFDGARLGLPFKDGERPRIYLSGASALAKRITIESGDCWLRYGDTPEGIAVAARELLEAGRSVGIRMHVLARETREEAHAEVAAMMANSDEAHRQQVQAFVKTCDSEAVKKSFDLAEQASGGWLSPMLWTGAVAYRGGPALCVVGSYDEVARYLLEYKQAGVSEFILSGWPTRGEMRRFCHHVLPLIRQYEARTAGSEDKAALVI